jgi:hypothetical protein
MISENSAKKPPAEVSSMLDRLDQFFKQYLSCSPEQRIVLQLWTRALTLCPFVSFVVLPVLPLCPPCPLWFKGFVVRFGWLLC